MKTLKPLLSTFLIPLLVLGGIILYWVLIWARLDMPAVIVILSSIALGTYQMFVETVRDFLHKKYGLDYIAILAIVFSLVIGDFFVGSIIALMLSSGRTLEEYGVKKAQESLTALTDRIPQEVRLFAHGEIGDFIHIAQVKKGQEIYMRKGEVIPLDGIMVSPSGYTDESSLTGEPYLMDKIEGDLIRSGTVNIGEAIVIRVTKEEKDSTYRKIIEMVQSAREEKAPLVRLANRYSGVFTLVTLTIVGLTYAFTQDLTRVLSVLVIATPCPLILATPIALMGGVNAAAKQRIIVKKLASLEVLSRIHAMIFDKTGTLTIGKPSLTEIHIADAEYTEKTVLSIAEAIERSSLHPFAKAVITHAKSKHVPVLHATDIQEVVGHGIQGDIEGKTYSMNKLQEDEGMAIEMQANGKRVAILRFQDTPKKDSKNIVDKLKSLDIDILIFTGDKQSAAKKIAEALHPDIVVKAECSPKDKQDGIQRLKSEGKVTAMVGDGINDAPALALADVGMVFSNEEQTAASEAADIVFLGGDFSLVFDSVMIAKRTVRIALQSIFWGIGLSITGMLFASFGYIPALVGAIIQEAIDVTVIINALRASWVHR